MDPKIPHPSAVTRAKFVVQKREENREGFKITMQPVYQDSNSGSENSKFYRSSPSGELVLQTVNAHAAEHLKPGREFYLDMIPTDAVDEPKQC